MISSSRRRGAVRLAVTLAAIVAVGVAVPAHPASAEPAGAGGAAHGIRTAPVLSFDLTTAGFVLPGPNPRPAGPVTFRATTQDARGHFWSTFKLLNDTDLLQALEWFDLAHSPDKAVALRALRDLYTNVQFTGGIAVYPSSPIGLTVNLTPGLYYITDYLIPPFPTGTAGVSATRESSADRSLLGPALEGVAAVLRAHAGRAGATAARGPARAPAGPAAAEEPVRSPFGLLFVTEEYELAAPPAFQAVLTMRDVNGAAVFRPIGRFRARGAFLFHNGSSMPQEVTFEKVLPNTTDRDVQDYYDHIIWGGDPAPNPFPGIRPGGELLLSPGLSVVVQTEFAPGLYCGLSFVTNWNTAVKQAYEGVHIVLQLR
jgi:hypothetical protein